MYLKKIFKIFIFAVLVCPFGVRAQQFTNSPYSRYGIGDIFTNGSGHNIAMGGTSIAESTPYFLNTVNPAANTNLLMQRFVFDVGFDVKYTKTESSTQSQKNCNSTFRYLQGGFAVKPWWSFTFGISPYSAVGYYFQDTIDVVSSDGQYSRKYYENFGGSGGLSEVTLSTAMKAFKIVSFGIKGKYIFGEIEHCDSTVLHVPGYKSFTYYSNKNIIRGFSYDLGILAQKSFKSKKDSLKNALKLSAGFYFSQEVKLNSRSELFLSSYNTLVATIDTIANDTLYDGKITVPKSYGVGFSAEVFDKFTFNFDYKYQNWKNFSLPGRDNHQTLKENKYIGLGLQFVAAKFSSRYYKTINYRIGVRKNETYLRLQGENIQDKGITFGLGFPIKSLLLNVSCDFGVRGTTEHNLYKEKYFLMHFNITAHDVWFVKRKFQ